MKIDSSDPILWLITISLIISVAGMVLLYQFIWIPKQAEIEKYKEKYPTHCLVERNQTVRQLNEWDRVTLYQPVKVCQVLTGGFPNADNSTGYFVTYQYETQSKYNKTYSEYDLNCKPKSFDELTGNLICFNGTIAKEKWSYAQ